MDQASLAQAAQSLDELLRRYAKVDPAAAILHHALMEPLQVAILGQLQQPLAWGDIPGGRLFTETSLDQYPDLESAWARFKIEVTGGETPALKAMRARTKASRTEPHS